MRKDIASSSGATDTSKDDDKDKSKDSNEDEDDFSSKAQIMTLMTTDVDRVSDFSWHMFTLVGTDLLLQLCIFANVLRRFADRNCYWYLVPLQLTWRVVFRRACCHLLVLAFEPLWRQGCSQRPREFNENS